MPRLYPVLVYIRQERQPSMAADYAITTTQDCERNYYDFCNRLLDIL
jgi:hypothetical protein